ncbi:mannosyltransferase [Ceratobasidium sp. 414]|nr:mannosyltransferase [Ceratobasidium sp. 414]
MLELIALVTILALWVVFHRKKSPVRRSVAILVLGDVGRSPRMMYHAQSLAENQFNTYLIGYSGSTLIKALRELPNLTTLSLIPPPKFVASLPQQLFVLAAPFKLAIQTISILWTLLVDIPAPEYIMVQNPPSIPTLILVQFVCWVRSSKLVIDWHNLGYSILALRLGNRHMLVKMAKSPYGPVLKEPRVERTFGQHAYLHLFVTDAMKDKLVKEWKLMGKTLTLHDRPPSHFRRSNPAEIHDLFNRLQPVLPVSVKPFLPESQSPSSSAFTKVTSSSSAEYDPMYASPGVVLRRDRPALLVSSTSWTADEDFSILLDAFTKYEQRAKEGGLPKLLALITGKGPLRNPYMAKVARLEKDQKWEWVRCASIWLEPDDYPVLLGSADLGVSLHASSSGLDLPMKVVDMFGCALPVCALDFECLDELVKDGVNGLKFRDTDELVEQIVASDSMRRAQSESNLLQSLFSHFPETNRLDALRQGLNKRTRISAPSGMADEGQHLWNDWTDNWNAFVRPILLHDIDTQHPF